MLKNEYEPKIVYCTVDAFCSEIKGTTMAQLIHEETENPSNLLRREVYHQKPIESVIDPEDKQQQAAYKRLISCGALQVGVAAEPDHATYTFFGLGLLTAISPSRSI